MKRIAFFILFSVVFNAVTLADGTPIVIQNGGAIGDHSGFPMIPADQPDVYYDSTNQCIIIDGSGCVSYYDVEITSLSSWPIRELYSPLTFSSSPIAPSTAASLAS